MKVVDAQYPSVYGGKTTSFDANVDMEKTYT